MKAMKLFLAVLLLTACSKTVMEKQGAVEQQTEPAIEAAREPQEPSAVKGQAAAMDPREREMFMNEHIYFDFDSTVLRSDAQSLLQIKAQWLQDNPDVIAVMIQGHSDERGTEAYNLALGAKRAETVRKYLIDMGLVGRTMEAQSYGEEKPAEPGHNEESWAKNRRACFVIN
jgi:peptidoglycan-associated lipoprotein